MERVEGREVVSVRKDSWQTLGILDSQYHAYIAVKNHGFRNSRREASCDVELGGQLDD